MKKRKGSDSDVEFGGESRRLTPIDVQQQQFRRSFRGYDEQEVDDFLDRVTEELSVLQEERRTAAEHGQGQVLTTPLADVGHAAEATRAAEGIKRRAQEQAEAIVRDAQARAAAILRDADARAGTAASGGSASSDAPVPSAAGSAALSSFVSREREFLQRLAQLVQGHAEGVRDMVQSARRAQQAPAKADTGSPPAASPPAGIAPVMTPEAPDSSEVPPAPPIPAAPEASPAFPAPSVPEAPSAPEAASAPEAPSAPMPPPDGDRARPGSEGGPAIEAAAADPVSQRAAVVLLPEAGEPTERSEAPEAVTATEASDLPEAAEREAAEPQAAEPSFEPSGPTSPAEPSARFEPSEPTEHSEPSARWSAPEPPRLPDLPAPPEFAEPSPKASTPATPAVPAERPVAVPRRAADGASKDDDEGSEPEREASLRELFWGED